MKLKKIIEKKKTQSHSEGVNAESADCGPQCGVRTDCTVQYSGGQLT